VGWIEYMICGVRCHYITGPYWDAAARLLTRLAIDQFTQKRHSAASTAGRWPFTLEVKKAWKTRRKGGGSIGCIHRPHH